MTNKKTKNGVHYHSCQLMFYKKIKYPRAFDCLYCFITLMQYSIWKRFMSKMGFQYNISQISDKNAHDLVLRIGGFQDVQNLRTSIFLSVFSFLKKGVFSAFLQPVGRRSLWTFLFINCKYTLKKYHWFWETKCPFYDISVNNAMSADKYACKEVNLEL